MYNTANPYKYPFLDHDAGDTNTSANDTNDPNTTNVHYHENTPFPEQTTLTLDRVHPQVVQTAGENYSLAQLAVFNSKLRAAMAKQALDNTTMLALAEQQCLQIAPNGADEYRKIVQAYAYSSIRNILGGD